MLYHKDKFNLKQRKIINSIALLFPKEVSFSIYPKDVENEKTVSFRFKRLMFVLNFSKLNNDITYDINYFDNDKPLLWLIKWTDDINNIKEIPLIFETFNK